MKAAIIGVSATSWLAFATRSISDYCPGGNFADKRPARTICLADWRQRENLTAKNTSEQAEIARFQSRKVDDDNDDDGGSRRLGGGGCSARSKNQDLRRYAIADKQEGIKDGLRKDG